MAVWGFDLYSGGVKIPEWVKERTKQRILAYAEQHYAGKYIRKDVRYMEVIAKIVIPTRTIAELRMLFQSW